MEGQAADSKLIKYCMSHIRRILDSDLYFLLTPFAHPREIPIFCLYMPFVKILSILHC